MTVQFAISWDGVLHALTATPTDILQALEQQIRAELLDRRRIALVVKEVQQGGW